MFYVQVQQLATGRRLGQPMAVANVQEACSSRAELKREGVPEGYVVHAWDATPCWWCDWPAPGFLKLSWQLGTAWADAIRGRAWQTAWCGKIARTEALQYSRAHGNHRRPAARDRCILGHGRRHRNSSGRGRGRGGRLAREFDVAEHGLKLSVLDFDLRAKVVDVGIGNEVDAACILTAGQPAFDRDELSLNAQDPLQGNFCSPGRHQTQ